MSLRYEDILLKAAYEWRLKLADSMLIPGIEIRKIAWRDVPRIGLPFYIIGRPIRALGDRLVRIGPDCAVKLERLEQWLDDTPTPSRLRLLLQGAVRWMISTPNSAHQAIPEETGHDPSLPPMPDLLPVSVKEVSAPSPRGHQE